MNPNTLENANERTRTDYQFLNRTIFERGLSAMPLWNTIKKDENWSWVDTDRRLLDKFPERKLIDFTWQNDSMLDQSMDDSFIVFYAGDLISTR